MFGLVISGWAIPQWLFDWTGSVLVVVSLVRLFRKNRSYWHWSNASLVPYVLLFLDAKQWMLFGLQVSYLLFGLHGLYLWHLEYQRDQHGRQFAESRWYAVTWAISIGIFGYTVALTDFGDRWNWVQFLAVASALIANFATTRKWAWSWPVWIVVNAVQAVYFFHLALWGQFGLQFILAAMSVYGWQVWLESDRHAVAERQEVSHAI